MKRTYLTLIIMMLVIGFAAVTTNLVINGTINIGFNEDEFNVYFSYARIDATESEEIISSDKQNIIFTTNKLTDINQSSTLYYEVTNSSKQYDANVEVTCDEGTELYSIENTLNDTTIKARSVSKGKVIVTLNKISTEEKEIEFECHLNVTAISRSEEENKEVPEICHYDEGFEWDFDYTGGEQEFTVPCNGTYKLEVWGAQGGLGTDSNEINSKGGLGGYSKGEIQLVSSSNLYINVGGQGENLKTKGSNQESYGGYNGGGKGINNAQRGSGGGGATHIAKVSGLLPTLSSKTNDILIVAGGGGGNGDNYYGAIPYGGSGGGFEGKNGTNDDIAYPSSNLVDFFGTGATQNSAGYKKGNGTNGKGSFGSGGDYYNDNNGGCGGGGGFYGGGGSSRGHAGAGGGSGYIGNTLLTNKAMYCYQCETSDAEETRTYSVTNASTDPISEYAKQGNGYAKITLVNLEN